MKYRFKLLHGGAGRRDQVPTLDGRVKLKVPGETQTGKLLPHARQGREVRPRWCAG
ncbi:hypothetical protein ACNKHO_00110 [Shigella flexneri]